MKSYLIIGVFLWFLLSAIVSFFQGQWMTAATALTMSIGLPVGFSNQSTMKLVGALLLVIGVCNVFSQFQPAMTDQKDYIHALQETTQGNYPRDLEPDVRQACGLQGHFDQIQTAFDLVTSIYLDAFGSAALFVWSQLTETPPNACKAAVQKLKKKYPRFNDKFVP